MDALFDMLNDIEAPFCNHPASSLEIDKKVLYLNGLALIMNVDGIIDATEKDYIKNLIASFELDAELLQEVIAFSQQPNKETLQDFFAAFKDQEAAQSFLIDAAIIAYCDKDFHAKEEQFFDSFAQRLGIGKQAKEQIISLAATIRNGRQAEFTKDDIVILEENLQYLLDFYQISPTSLYKEDKKALTDLIHFDWVQKDGQQQSATPVNNRQFTTYLQWALDEKQILVEDNKVCGLSGILHMELDSSKISFSYADNHFDFETGKGNEAVSGFTPTGVKAFCKATNLSIQTIN